MVTPDQRKIIDSIEVTYRKIAGLPPDKSIDYWAKKSGWEENRQFGSTFTDSGRSTWLTVRDPKYLNMLSVGRDYEHDIDDVQRGMQPDGRMRTLKIRTRNSQNHRIPEILTILNLAPEQINFETFEYDTEQIGYVIEEAIKSIGRKPKNLLEHHMLTRIKNDFIEDEEDQERLKQIASTSWDGGKSSLLVITPRQYDTKLKIRTFIGLAQNGYNKKHEMEVAGLLDSHKLIIDDLRYLKY